MKDDFLVSSICWNADTETFTTFKSPKELFRKTSKFLQDIEG